MAGKSTYRTPFRRRREGKTDFRKRLALLKSGKNRFVVRILSNNVICQVVQYTPGGDKVLVSASSLELAKYGWKGHTGNAPAAYLTGLLCGIKAKEVKVGECVLDIGLHTPVKGSNVFAALRGAVDAGMSIPHSDDSMPEDKRISGKIIAAHTKNKDLPKNFQEVKTKIMKGMEKNAKKEEK